ncbi:MAG: hypothetical protein HZA89_18415 [Verrucomicrobia bacterium]|nr:hypothetical protein [Verrucomicrobiota bacterium]
MAALVIILAMSCAGCQTFSLTKEQWEAQQRGERVDAETAKVVETAGTMGYYGLFLGELLSAVLRK